MPDRHPQFRLSDRQRELLELISSGVTASKDLAKVTRLSPGYIDKVLSQAAKTLGSADRVAAASAYKKLQLSDPPADRRPERLPGSIEIGSIEGTSSDKPVLRTILDIVSGPDLGGKQHKLRWDQIMVQIFWVAMIGFITVMTLVLIILGFFRTFS